MEKTLKYTLTLSGAFPEDILCGGVQGESGATKVVFEADSSLEAKITEYKSKGYTLQAQISAVTIAGELVGKEERQQEKLFDPFYLTEKITASGLDVIIVYKIVIVQAQKELCKAQIKLCFIPSPVSYESKSEQNREAEELKASAQKIMFELEEKAETIEETMNKKLFVVKETANQTARQLKTVKQIADQAQKTKISLETGSEFVFVGGDANTESEARIIIDAELSKTSDNAVSNSAVTTAIENLSADYVVEQGANGIWTYRKWASGVAECWGTVNCWRANPALLIGEAAIPFAISYINTQATIVYEESENIVDQRTIKMRLEDNILRCRIFSNVDYEEGYILNADVSVKGRWK